MIDVKKFVDDKLRHGVQNTENFSISYRTVLMLMEDLQRLLQQTDVSGSLPIETTLSNIVYDFCEMDVTTCCKIGPIVRENYCPNCGKKIVRNDR